MEPAKCLSNPPWKKEVVDILQKNLDKGHKGSLNFCFATVKTGSLPRPAVRTVVFRGFVGESWGSEPPSQVSEGNCLARSSLFLVSTDALTAKVEELEQSKGAFEVCWWHAGTNQQIRFNGTAHLYSPRCNVGFPETYLRRYIHTDGNWRWEDERERIWKSHKPEMRGSFRNPHPGTPLDEEKKQKLRIVKLDGDDSGPDMDEAKSRFTLLVLEAKELEILDLDSFPVSLSVS